MTYRHLAVCLTAICASLFAATQTVFDYSTTPVSTFENTPNSLQGIRLTPPVDGAQWLPMTVLPGKGGGGSAYVSTAPGSLGVRDWSACHTLICTLRNPQRQRATVMVTLKDERGKEVSLTWNLSGAMEERFSVKLADLASRLKLNGMTSVRLSLSPRSTPLNLELGKVLLEDSQQEGRVATDSRQPIARSWDIRKASYKLTGKTTVTREADGSLIMTSQRYQRGDQASHIIFSLGEMDFPIATHFSYEVELLSEQGNYLGTSLANAAGKSLWQGLGALGPGAPTRGQQQIYDTAMVKAPLKTFTFMLSARDWSYQKIRIKKFQFEFQAETVMDIAKPALVVLLRQHLTASQRQRGEALKRRLYDAYGAVCRKTLLRGDALRFLEAATEVRAQARSLLREVNLQLASAIPGLGYGVATADSMSQVFLEGPGAELTTGAQFLELAANETESFQTVVIAGDRPLKDVRVSVSPFEGAGGKHLSSMVALVGHSKTPVRDYPCEYTGFYPEMILLNQTQSDVGAHETLPFWVRIQAPAGTPAGRYSAWVTVQVSGHPSHRFPLTVEVFDFSLPDGTAIPTCFSFNRKNYEQMYGTQNDRLQTEAYIDKVVDLATEYRVNYDQIYWWGMWQNTFYPHYLKTLKRLNDAGKLTHFCVAHLYYPGKGYRQDFSIKDPHDPETEILVRRNAKFFKDQMAIIRKLGLEDKAYFYGFDEGFPNPVIGRIIDEVKKEYPKVPILTTMRYGDPNLPDAKGIDCWIAPAQRFVDRHELVQKFRQSGRQVYWYVCNYPRPPQPTFLLEVPGLVPRLLMGAMTQKYQPDGFLYWATNVWSNNKKPVGKGPRTSWNVETCAGDSSEGQLFYPGENRTVLPAIRLENYRDGLEDHWYYKLLERAVQAGKGTAEQRKQARQLLQVPEHIVKDSWSYTVDPQDIRAERRKLAKLLEALR